MTNQVGDEKQCPACAETVKAAAVRCRFCGYDFAGRRMPGRAPAARERQRIGGGVPILAVIAALLILGYCTTRVDEAPSRAASAPRDEALAMMEMRPGAVKVTASELYQAYEANEAAAQGQYGGRLLEVTGTVDGVDLDLMDDPIVKLAAGDRYDHADVSLIEAEKYKAAGFAKGQKIIFLCQGISEVIGTPILSNCIVAERL